MDDQGPKELKQDDSNRMFIYYAFLTLTLMIIPIWLFTTSVPRNSCTIPSYVESLPLHLKRLNKVQLVLINAEESEWREFEDMTIHPFHHSDEKVIAFDEEVDLKVIRLQMPIEEINISDKTVLSAAFEQKLPSLTNEFRTILIANSENPSIWLHPSKMAMIVTGCQNQINFWEPQIFLEDLFSAFLSSTSTSEPLSDSRLLPVASKYRVTFTLLVGQTKDRHHQNQLWDWEALEAFEKYMEPLVRELRSVADFSFNFQIRPHIELAVDPLTQINQSNQSVHIVPKEYIPVFVDENSWNMAKSIDSGTPIEFAILIPPPSSTPLYFANGIQTETNKAYKECFAYRQWGSVCILNRLPSDTNKLNSGNLKESFAFFAGHLRHLFPVSINTSPLHGFDIEATSDPYSGISVFEKETLKRQAIKRRLQTALETLAALKRLFLTNKEIPILPKPAALIKLSIESISEAKAALAESNIEKALYESAMAAEQAERAFFDPSMMAHQYFPEDHKLGVYMPLFFPFILPIVMASAALLRKHIQARKSLKTNKTD